MESKLIEHLSRYWRHVKLTTSTSTTAEQIDCVCLEDRILYSAAPLELPTETIDWSDVEHQVIFPDVEAQIDLVQYQLTIDQADIPDTLPSKFELWSTDLEPNSLAIDFSLEPASQPVEHLVFINHDVSQLDQLIADLQSGLTQPQVFILNGQTDGIQQVTEILKRQGNVASVHFVSHGIEGQVHLGNSTLSMQDLNQYESQLASWRNYLSQDADLMFYGCNLAASQAGIDLVDSLAKITEADVAASNDLTGHQSFGGNWVLELQHGQIESDILFSASLQESWAHLLVPPSLTLPGGPVSYVFGDSPTIIDGAAFLDDPDSADFDTGTLTISITNNGTTDDRLWIDTSGSLNIKPGNILEWKSGGPGVSFGTISGGGASPLVITFDANSNDFYVEELLRNITFENVSAAPSTALRTVQFVMTDGDGGTSNTATEFINVINPAPIIDLDANNSTTLGNGFITTYVHGSGSALIADVDAVISDANSGNLNQLTARIVTGYINGDDQLTFNSTLATSYGITGTWSAGPGRLLLSGTATVAQYQDVLRTIAFTDLSGNPDATNNRIIDITVRDDSNVVSAIAKSEIYISKALGLWLTTEGNVSSPNGTTSLPSWDKEDVIQFGSSGLLFEPAGNTTGTASLAVDMSPYHSKSLTSLHFVSRDMTIGGGINTVSLLYGDVLFSVKDPATIGGFNVGAYDLLRFRPSDGTFDVVAYDLSGAFRNISAMTLIEQDTVVGGTSLSAGSFLFVVANPGGAKNDVYYFDPTALGSSVWAAGAYSKLLEGDDIGVNERITGLDLVESNIAIGGTILQKGWLMLSVDTTDSGIGDIGTPITATRSDIFYLNVDKTLMDAIPGSSAEAFMLFTGSKVELTRPEESFSGFSLQTTKQASVYATASNLSPNDISPDSFAVNENTDTTGGFTVGILSATDPDIGETFTYSINGGTDAALFSIGGASGNELRINNGILNFEAQGSFLVNVRVLDSVGNSYNETLTLNVNDLNEVPVVNNQLLLVDENTNNGTVVGSIVASDPDAGLNGNRTFSVTGGTGATAFSVNSAGQITVADSAQLDFETNPTFTLNVLVTDGGTPGLTDTATITINLNDKAEILVVDTTSDVVDGNVSSINALISSRGIDGRISLREAIAAANNSANNGTPDIIRFAIPDSDANHRYYRNDGIAGSLTLIATTTLSDAAITDFDPDYAYTPHSWFRINLNNALPQLTITDAVVIDGYSQSGATQNTQALGHNASLKIELTNAALDSNRGLTFDTGANGSTVKGLAINGFGGVGVMVDYDVHNVTIQGNFIGTDITGTKKIANGDAGIQLRSNSNLIGGVGVADRNVISGNDNRGIALFYGTYSLTGNVIQNNYIGVNATGTAGLGNLEHGIQLWNDNGTRVIDNVISGNQTQGILFRNSSQTHNAVIQGNLIGVGANGATIIANGAEGIRVESNSATGNTLGGTGAGQRNIICGNGLDGIHFTGSGVSGNSVYGNTIGTDLSGLLDLGNNGSGILISGGSAGNTIGGVGAGQANTIAFNSQNGVRVTGNTSDRNSIRGNIFKNNDDLAIDHVGSNGVDTNDLLDSDNQANQLQNYPVLLTAVSVAGDLTVTGSLNSTANTNGLIIDFYWSLTGDPSLHGEAGNYINSIVVNTDAFGNATINTTFIGAGVPVGVFITATATDASGNTSEFSLNSTVTGISNAPPTDISPNSIAIDENTNTTAGLNIATLTASDPDSGETFAYSIAGGIDAALFSIVSGDQLRMNAGILDFEVKSVYSINVRVQDSVGNTYVETLTVTVNDLNESPVIANQTFAINENTGNGTVVGNIVASDPDAGANGNRTFTVTGGSGASAFSVNSAGQITVADSLQLNFEAATSFTLNVLVTDGGTPGLTNTATITINLNDLNETPLIVSYPTTMAENQTIAGLVTAYDQDDFPLTFSVTGGADGGLFSIDPSTGLLKFLTPPDFELQTDFGGNNQYEVIVSVTDAAGLSTANLISILIIDVTDSPVIIVPPPVTPPIVIDPDTKTDDDSEEPLISAYSPTPNNIESADDLPDTSVTNRLNPLDSLSEQSSDSTYSYIVESNLNATGFFFVSIENQKNRMAADAFNLQGASDLGFVTSAGWLWHDLDMLNKQMDAQARLGSFWTVVAPSITTSISVGYLMWLIKGGQIMAGLMAQVPAWKLIAIDPLPILRSVDDDENENDRESLATMVDEARSDSFACGHEMPTNSNSNLLADNTGDQTQTTPLKIEAESPWDWN